MTITAPFSKPGGWVLSNQSILPSGQVFTGPGSQLCQEANPQACNNWIASKHLRQLVTYQPASRFWPLQWIETAIYLALAGALGWICAWQVRRRRT